MTSCFLGQYLINGSPCHRIQTTEGRTEGDTGQLLQKDVSFHVKAKAGADGNLRELAFSLGYCSELLSILNVRANVLHFCHLCIPLFPQPKSCSDVCCISRSLAECTKCQSSGLKMLSSSQTIRESAGWLLFRLWPQRGSEASAFFFNWTSIFDYNRLAKVSPPRLKYLTCLTGTVKNFFFSPLHNPAPCRNSASFEQASLCVG